MSNSKKNTIHNPVNPDHVADAPGLLEYAHHVGSALIKPDNLDVIKNNAVQALVEQTDIQLQQIKDQIDLLARQAKGIIERRTISMSIYQANLRFKPVIGQHYYLYKLEQGDFTLSMIGPNEWGKKGMPYEEFLHKVRLRGDHTWEIEE